MSVHGEYLILLLHLQGGPHNNNIAALCVALKEASSPSFATYQRQTVLNAKTLAAELALRGQTIVTGGTDNHLLLVDVTPLGIGGKIAENAAKTMTNCAEFKGSARRRRKISNSDPET